MSVFLLAIFCAVFGWLPHPGVLHVRKFASVPNSEHVLERYTLLTPVLFESRSSTGEGGAQHTLGHENCPACGAAKNLAMDPRGFGSLAFSEAFPIWLETRTRISEGTRQDYKKNFKRLEPFFGAMHLCNIHIGHVLEYRKLRQEKAGAGRINKELNTLSQILSKAGLWDEIAKWYEPLPLPKVQRGIALSEEEERYFFEVAQRKSKWSTAYFAELLSRNTGIGPGELRHLRLGAVDLGGHCLKITEGVKNGYRERIVPLSDVAYWSVLQLIERAADRGSITPEHYLLPARKKCPANKIHPGFDPTQPMRSWKKAHESIREEVAKKYPRLKNVRIYDVGRHTCATVMLENPIISYGTIERILGHRLGSNTKDWYNHVRDQALREAVGAIETRRAPSAVRGQMYSFQASGKKG